MQRDPALVIDWHVRHGLSKPSKLISAPIWLRRRCVLGDSKEVWILLLIVLHQLLPYDFFDPIPYDAILGEPSLIIATSGRSLRKQILHLDLVVFRMLGGVIISHRRCIIGNSAVVPDDVAVCAHKRRELYWSPGIWALALGIGPLVCAARLSWERVRICAGQPLFRIHNLEMINLLFKNDIKYLLSSGLCRSCERKFI